MSSQSRAVESHRELTAESPIVTDKSPMRHRDSTRNRSRVTWSHRGVTEESWHSHRQFTESHRTRESPCTYLALTLESPRINMSPWSYLGVTIYVTCKLPCSHRESPRRHRSSCGYAAAPLCQQQAMFRRSRRMSHRKVHEVSPHNHRKFT